MYFCGSTGTLWVYIKILVWERVWARSGGVLRNVAYRTVWVLEQAPGAVVLWSEQRMIGPDKHLHKL